MNYLRVSRALFRYASLLAALAAAGCERTDRPIAIVGATVVVGQELEPVADANIVFRNGRIVCVDVPERCPIDGVRQTIDARGKWIIPGLDVELVQRPLIVTAAPVMHATHRQVSLRQVWRC